MCEIPGGQGRSHFEYVGLVTRLGSDDIPNKAEIFSEILYRKNQLDLIYPQKLLKNGNSNDEAALSDELSNTNFIMKVSIREYFWKIFGNNP